MLASMRDVGYRRVVLMPRVEIEERITRLQRHHDFFERAVAGALAYAVDGALDLAGAGDYRGQTVGHGHAQIVVAVDRQTHLADAAHVLAQIAEQLGKLIGYGVTDRVRNIHRGGAGLDRRPRPPVSGNPARCATRPRARTRRPRTRLARDLHALDRGADDFLLRHVQLVLPMDGAGREKHVDAMTRRDLRAPWPPARCLRDCSARDRR